MPTTDDREAAAKVAWKSPKFIRELLAGEHDDAEAVQVMAAHREAAVQAERAAVVAFLKHEAFVAWGLDANGSDDLSCAADRIAAGEHRKEG